MRYPSRGRPSSPGWERQPDAIVPSTASGPCLVHCVGGNRQDVNSGPPEYPTTLLLSRVWSSRPPLPLLAQEERFQLPRLVGCDSPPAGRRSPRRRQIDARTVAPNVCIRPPKSPVRDLALRHARPSASAAAQPGGAADRRGACRSRRAMRSTGRAEGPCCQSP